MITVLKGRSMANGIVTVDHLRRAIDGLDGDTPISPMMQITLFESADGMCHVDISEDDL